MGVCGVKFQQNITNWVNWLPLLYLQPHWSDLSHYIQTVPFLQAGNSMKSTRTALKIGQSLFQVDNRTTRTTGKVCLLETKRHSKTHVQGRQPLISPTLWWVVSLIFSAWCYSAHVCHSKVWATFCFSHEEVESDWSPIHDAAFNGHVLSLQRLISQVKFNLPLELNIKALLGFCWLRFSHV